MQEKPHLPDCFRLEISVIQSRVRSPANVCMKSFMCLLFEEPLFAVMQGHPQKFLSISSLTAVSSSLLHPEEALSTVPDLTCRWRRPSVWCNPEGHTQHKLGRHPCTERFRRMDSRRRCVPHRRGHGDTRQVDRGTQV